MRNNIDNSLNFKGAYLIKYKNMVPELRAGFDKAIGGKKGQLFDNFNGRQNEVMYIIRNSRDYDAAEFIRKNKLKFEYLPDLNTKCRFEESNPEQVVEYISANKPTVISKISELMKYVKENRMECRAPKCPQVPLYKRVLEKLCINIEGKWSIDDKGITRISDAEHGGFVRLSPKKSNGISYMYIKPSNSYDETLRIMVDDKANILARFESADEIITFKKRFQEAMKEFAVRKHRN